MASIRQIQSTIIDKEPVNQAWNEMRSKVGGWGGKDRVIRAMDGPEKGRRRFCNDVAGNTESLSSDHCSVWEIQRPGKKNRQMGLWDEQVYSIRTTKMMLYL